MLVMNINNMEEMAVYLFIVEGNGFPVPNDIVLGSSCI
jgi:hypothetical protein